MKQEPKKPTPFDLENYTKVGCLAVDMSVAAIIHERRRGKDVKAIILHPAYYEMFQAWVRREYGEETAEKEFIIDLVQIRREKISTGKAMMIEYNKLEDIN